MPHKIITLDQLAMLKLPVFPRACLRRLPWDYLTTYLGVQRAMEEIANDTTCPQETVLMALIKRGGTSHRRIVYPENIIPLLHFSDFDADMKQDDPYDTEYWEELHVQGELWYELDTDY
jgi:hypothetical protein